MTKQFNENYKTTTNMVSSKGYPELEIYNHVDFTEEIQRGYLLTRIDIFAKETAKKAMFDYLYNGIGGTPNDIKHSNGERDKGWLTCATLYLMRIKPSSNSRGSLKRLNQQEAQRIISNAIEVIYK